MSASLAVSSLSSVGAMDTLLLVDDDPENIAVLAGLLRPHYRLRVATDGLEALRIATRQQPDLILLDVLMPVMDGYAVLERLQADPSTQAIPVVFVTGLVNAEDEERGLALGAVDYIIKPFRPAIVRARIHTQLELKHARDRLLHQKEDLEAEVSRRLKELLVLQDVSILALAHLAETRDTETGNHLRRTQGYVRLLASLLLNHPRYGVLLDAGSVELLAKSAPLHDIGKVGIPDHILLKPGKLNADEWAVMKTHAQLGSEAIEHAERDAEGSVAFLAHAKDIAHYHHEKWDGSGYPMGLVGEAIPLSARMMALADVFDALISKRVYKPALSYEVARDQIQAESGSHFDPIIVETFLGAFERFVAIAERHRDPGKLSTG
jgi:putative two-component system response regulator